MTTLRYKRASGWILGGLVVIGCTLALYGDHSRDALADDKSCNSTSSAFVESGCGGGTTSLQGSIATMTASTFNSQSCLLGLAPTVTTSSGAWGAKASATATTMPNWYSASYAADFDGDGFTDIAIAGQSSAWITWAKNESYCAAGTADASCTATTTYTTPNFVQQDSGNATGAGKSGLLPVFYTDATTASKLIATSIVAGDFNGDGCADIFVVRNVSDTFSKQERLMFLNVKSSGTCTGIFSGSYNGTSAFSGNPFDPVATSGASNLGIVDGQGHTMTAVDFNHDGKMDLLASNNQGQVVLLTNQGNGGSLSEPTFKASILIGGTPTGHGASCTANPNNTWFAPNGTATMANPCSGGNATSKGLIGIEAVDPIGSGKVDILVSGAYHPSCPSGGKANYIELFVQDGTGTGSGSFSSAPLQLSFKDGAGTNIVAGDFNADGKNDFAVTSDKSLWQGGGSTCSNGGKDPGGDAWFFKNTSTANIPSFASPVQIATQGTTATSLTTLNTAAVLDYDKSTCPEVFAAGSTVPVEALLGVACTTTTSYAAGTITSNTVDTSAASNNNLNILSACITPTLTQPTGTTVSYRLSNNGGTSFLSATAAAAGSNTYCVNFTTAGHNLKWQIRMSPDSTGTLTPTMSSVSLTYTYENATAHFASGATATTIKYFGDDTFPGDQGKFWAYSLSTNTPFWVTDAGNCLDNPGTCSGPTSSNRQVFTALNPGGTYNTTLEPFNSTSTSDPDFQSLLQVPDDATAQTLESWWYGARFGIATLHVLGGDDQSTPAILTPPGLPYWYNFSATPSAERSALGSWVSSTAMKNRPDLVLVETKDGALHAFDTDPSATAGTTGAGGQEAWAYIPPDIAGRLYADETNSSLTAYPDDSPTIADVYDGSSWHTLLVSGEGPSSGNQVFALDITDTADSSLSPAMADSTHEPTPLWNFYDPGTLGTSCGITTTSAMGFTDSKPAIARVLINGNEEWLAIFASGPYQTGTSGGTTIYAFDALTGGAANGGCPVWTWTLPDTSVWLANGPTVVDTSDASLPGPPTYDGYADFVLAGDSKGRVWMLNAATGALQTGANYPSVPGLSVKPVFSTNYSTGSPLFGTDAPIAGSISAQANSSNNLQLFFGTNLVGTSQKNAFYIVQASTGTIVSSFTTNAGEMVSGNAALVNGEVIFGTETDADTSGGLCTPGSGRVIAIGTASFTVNWIESLTSQVEGGVAASNGMVLANTQGGQQVTIGTYNKASPNGVGVSLSPMGFEQVQY
jgi:hypothetical protein